MLDRRTRHILDRFGVKYAAVAPCSCRGACARGNDAAPGREDRRASDSQPVDPVLARVDGRPTLVLVPRGSAVDVERLRREADAVAAHLAPEREFRELFPGCVPGGMPPLARLVGVDVFADAALADADEVALPLGRSGDECLAVRWADLVRLTNPLVGRFAGTPGRCEAASGRARLMCIN